MRYETSIITSLKIQTHLEAPHVEPLYGGVVDIKCVSRIVIQHITDTLHPTDFGRHFEILEIDVETDACGVSEVTPGCHDILAAIVSFRRGGVES